MEQEGVMKKLASRLVQAMDPEEAKGKLLLIIGGEDPYQAILDDEENPNPDPKKTRKRGGGRRKRSAPIPEGPSGENEQ